MSIYQEIYNLINTYIFGGLITAGSHQELVAILLSSAACIFIFALPFTIVLKIIKMIVG